MRISTVVGGMKTFGVAQNKTGSRKLELSLRQDEDPGLLACTFLGSGILWCLESKMDSPFLR